MKEQEKKAAVDFDAAKKEVCDVVEVENLSFSYKSDDEDEESRQKVFEDISFSIKKGAFVTLLGRNGSGKSTLAKHLNAILTPDGGRVLCLGADTSDETRLWDIRSNVGMVFQNPDNQIVATLVEEDVAFAPENLGLPQNEIRKRVDDALASVGMSEFKNHAPHRLSGGQKQRVAIAGILAMKPAVIVLDEATSMLDPVGRKEVLDTMIRLNKEEGITVVNITHYMEEALLSDQIMVTDGGKIVLSGTPKEVFSHTEEIKKLGLDVPQGVALFAELSKKGFSFKNKVPSTKECIDEILNLYKNIAQKQEI